MKTFRTGCLVMKKVLLLIMLTLLPPGAALAVKVGSLYQIEIPVASQSAAARDEAIKQGFIQVLTRVSANPDIGHHAKLKEMLLHAERYVQEFSYGPDESKASPYVIRISYGKDDIKRLLRRLGVSSWGENRPLIMVWLTMMQQGESPEIIGDESPDGLQRTMRQQGKWVGLPLVFPAMDVTDVSHINAEDVNAMALPALQEASKRYAPDAILIGNIVAIGHGFESRWRLLVGDQQWNWDVAADAPVFVVTKALREVNQALAKRYAVNSADEPLVRLKLEVSNITERDDLARLVRYLNQLSPVQQVELSEVSGDVVELTVLVRGPMERFEQNTLVGDRLLLQGQDVETKRLVYQWVH